MICGCGFGWPLFGNVCLSVVDDGGRYSYANQPQICRWNCEKLAEALKMSLPLHKSKASLTVFDEEYDQAYKAGMRAKVC